ncbi:peptidylprolyl isomerase [Seonamhaeicola sp. MEBiC1930]|uniref:peptidylprolyl isomerase n=1 Tax=Seonamhaeicola sp. MEBiC01930 TaxID=2976768 RepID=UPI00324A09A8
MRCFRTFAFILHIIPLFLSTSCKSEYPNLDDGIYAEFSTNKGTMVAKLFYKRTPITCANFITLTEGTNTMADSLFKEKKFYNNSTFHRVIDSFIIQSGRPSSYGMPDAGFRFIDEFDRTLKHDKKGILAMANPGKINSNGSQFYITHGKAPWLDAYDDEGFLKFCEEDYVYCHSVFGEVLIGLNIIDSIKLNDTLKTVNIIRKGKEAKNFDATKIFNDHFEEEAIKEKELKDVEEAIIKRTVRKFEKQKSKAETLPSGLQYFVSKPGEGDKLPKNAKVMTHYAVYLENGKLLETSNLETAKLLNALNERKLDSEGYKPIKADIGPDAPMIPGFKEGLQQLRVGDKATLFLPYHLAYGEAGIEGIPEKTNLIYEVEIIEIVK